MAYYDQIREVMSSQGNLSIERMCELTRVSRASFYRSFRDKHPVEGRWKYDRRFSRLLSNIIGATVTAALQQSCGGEACR